MRDIFKNRNVFFLIIILVASTLIITTISLSLIYNKAIYSIKTTLVDVVMRERAYINVFKDINLNEDQILSILQNVSKAKAGIGNKGDFNIVRKRNDSIEFLLIEQHRGAFFKKVPNIFAHTTPLMRSLNGESGIFKGYDSNGVNVYAAYTFIPDLKWGLIAKIPVAEVHKSYIQAGTLAFVLALCLISLCIYLVIRVTAPVIKSISDSESKLSLLFNNSADGVLIHDFQGNLLDANDTACNRLKYSKNEICKLNLAQIDSPTFYSKVPERMQELLTKGESVFETEHVTKYNDIIPTEINAKVINFNNASAVLSVARDISKRKEIESNLRESDEKFRMLIEVSMDAIMLNEKNRFTFVNNAALKLFGAKTDDQLINKTPFDLFHPDYHEIIKERIDKMHREGFPAPLLEEKIIRLDGNIVDVEVAATPFLYKGERSVLTVLRDITERKEAEAELKMNEFTLKQQNEEFLTLNEELNESNQRIQKINEDLLIAKQKAEESDRLKTAFLQNISHEIRTPLNAIMGFSELLQKQGNNAEQVEKYTQIILSRSSDLLEIINEILDIAKIESGQLTLNPVECNLDFLFEELKTIFSDQKRMGSKKLINLKFIPVHKTIITDTLKLRQIFVNLIGNAFKFTDTGFVEFGCHAIMENEIVFFVKDSGIGIPKEKQEFIFERFAQIKSNASKLYGGTGLGLTIVKGILDLMKGHIWMESEINTGTTFYFSIPTTTVVKGNHRTKLNIDVINLKTYSGTVLIVEDDEYNAEFLIEVLKKTDLRVFRATLGREAIDISMKENVDLILMDIRLPDMEGYEVTRQIKKMKPHVKIIAQTAYAAASDEEKALKAGCDDYVSKPIKKDLLLSKINMYLTGDICLNQ